jgi:hypothetical protein
MWFALDDSFFDIYIKILNKNWDKILKISKISPKIYSVFWVGFIN